MWKIARIATVATSVLLLVFARPTHGQCVCVASLVLVIIEWVGIRKELSFLPWNIMVMIVLTMLAALVSLVVGLGTGIVGALNKKVAIVVAIAAVMVAACAVVFIALYSFSGVAFSDPLIRRGAYELNKRNETAKIIELRTYVRPRALTPSSTAPALSATRPSRASPASTPWPGRSTSTAG